jgi:hypothetical protein
MKEPIHLLRPAVVALTLILCAMLVGQAKGLTPNAKAEALVNCASVPEPDPTPYGFAKAGLISLWYAKNASDRSKEMTADVDKASSAFGKMTAMMRTTKESTNDFICAKQPLKPFATKQSDENARIATTAMLVAHDQHIDLNRRAIELLKKMDSIPQSEFMDQISTLQVERGQRWADLVQPVSLGLLLLIADRPDEKGGTSWLNITKAQKQYLLDWAYKHFPEFKDGTPKDQWSEPAKTAELYLVLLNEHKGSDEPSK